MNKLLQRQIKEFFGGVNSAPKNLKPFFKAISDAYDGFDTNRGSIEQALDTSSKELTEINRKLQQEVSERKWVEQRLLAINQLQEHLLPPVPIEQKLKFVTDAVVEILDADFARVWTINPGDLCDSGCIHAEAKKGPHVCKHRDMCLHLMASSGRYTHTDGQVHRRVPFGCYKIGRVAAGEDDKFLTNDAVNDPRVHNHEWVRELGLVSFAGYRLMHTDGTRLGVLALFSKHSISPEEDALLEGIAHATSMVIHTSRMERQVRESEKRLNIVLSSILAGVVAVDAETHKIIDVNPLAAELIGLPKDQIVGKEYHDFICPAEAGKCSISDFGQVFDQEERILISGDGREIPILKTVAPASWQGRSYFIESFVNITERKKAEDQLKESERRVNTVLASISTGVAIVDAETHEIIDMNPAAVELVGIPKEKMIGQICHKFICPDKMGKCPITDLGRTVDQAECVLVRGDGGEVPVLKTVTPVSWQGHSYFIESFIDVTKRKQAEQHRIQLLDKLKRTNRELNDFVYIASHDLRTPLRGIATLANWIATDFADKLDDKGKEKVSLLITRVDRMYNLLMGILQYSKLSRIGEQETLVDINALVTEIADAVNLTGNITIKIENQLPAVKCVKTPITQVFEKLVGNAVKYMDKPHGWISIGCVEENGFWKFSVTDNGPGIEERYFKKIFQIFQTLSPHEQADSIGIGLSVVKKVVEMNGGRVWVESELGRGSTFFFTLPKQKADMENAELEVSAVG